MALRDHYSEAALRYYDQRRRTLVMRHGEDRVAEWEGVVEDHLASRTGHLPPLEALLLMSDIYGQGQWHESQRHPRPGFYTVELAEAITEPGLYSIGFEIDSPGKLKVTRVERTGDA